MGNKSLSLRTDLFSRAHRTILAPPRTLCVGAFYLYVSVQNEAASVRRQGQELSLEPAKLCQAQCRTLGVVSVTVETGR